VAITGIMMGAMFSNAAKDQRTCDGQGNGKTAYYSTVAEKQKLE
jgi:hypothetical protein